MKPNSSKAVRKFGSVSVAALALAAMPVASVRAQDEIPGPAIPTQTIPINPTGRDILLTAPLREGGFILGEIDFTLTADQRILIDATRLTELLVPLLDPQRLELLARQLAGKDTVSDAEMAAFGFPVNYDIERIALSIDIPADARGRRQLRLQQFNDELVGRTDDPAGVSGYINFRGSTDYVWSGSDKGLRAPLVLLDSAVRAYGMVLENEGILRLGGTEGGFIREGTRLIYDDPRRAARWTAGDLLPISRGFSGAPQIAGVSLVRSYSVLEPQRNVQPRGERTFTLTRPSTVEAFINGQPVRRIRLEPGTYDIRDFPFVQGANDVRLEIEDEAGVRNVIEFSLFFDRTLLEPGLTEFGIYAGVRAPFANRSRDYRFGEPAASGFIRRGITPTLTGGLNFQLQQRGGVIGVEAVTATSLGTFGGDIAFSKVDQVGSGYAVNLGYQTSLGGRGGAGRSLSVTVEHRSRDFATPSDFFADNRFTFNLAASYSQSLDERSFLAVTGQYAKGRDAFPDEQSVRATYGRRLADRFTVTVEGIYEDRANFERNYGARVSLVMRLGNRSSAIAEFDTRFERARLGYQTSRGEGVGAIAASADLEYSDEVVGADGYVTYVTNRAELSLAHRTVSDFSGRNLAEQRTSARFGTAIAFADGSFALSRPIFDSFAMVRAHESLDGAPVHIDPRDGKYSARSGIFGPAVEPNLSSYSDRVITYDVPEAPLGYDLGEGNIRTYPPYRAGYLITAGSDYSVTAIGQLLDQNGDPVALLSGRAVEIGGEDRPAITIFTNRAGNFGIQGLRPGRWLITMPTEPPGSIEIEISADEQGVVRLGTLTLGDAK